MSYYGLVFAMLATLSWSICIFPFTKAAREMGSVSLNHFRLLLALLLLGIISIFLDIHSFKELYDRRLLSSWIWLSLSGIIGLSIGDHFAFRMYAILGPRIGSVLITIAPAAALITGYFIIGETLSIIGILGMMITITGIIWISLSRKERTSIPDHGHGSIRSGIVFGILASVCQGAGIVLAKRGMITELSSSPEIHPLHATFLRLLSATVALYVFTTLQGKLRMILRPVLSRPYKGMTSAIAGTIFGPVIGVSMALYSVSYIKASVAQTIFSLVPVFALVLAYFFLKEKISFRAFIGVIVSISGVLILIWREELKNLF